ncbi:hypothetical protein ES288_A10G236800v1 [Gossypium darwinii]|uniref:MATH domain-containing protein n=1 Tax=Gossypium darwinii TaxID=34276 RepID=A0A5D2F2V1_GOSDA|nr:hypothetical protein ES288_A10G236800v1 [Gossypium darwinii]
MFIQRWSWYGVRAVYFQVVSDDRDSLLEDGAAEFKANNAILGFASLLALSELHDPKRGYLFNDACLLEAYVSTDRTEGLISHELMMKTDSDSQMTDEADSSTQSSEESVAFEPEDPTEEDMNTFFTSLESELSNSNIVFSQEEAKEALATLEEALDMTPVHFYGSRELSSLKQAFKILASFDCSSTALTIEQKNELLGMEQSLKELVSQAAKAMQGKNHLLAKESMKQTITRDLDRNLIRYKEIESEFAALLAERMGIFRTCQKKELEALGKELAEYEAKAKAAEEEEKTVEAEWGRIKGFISSIKGKI